MAISHRWSWARPQPRVTGSYAPQRGLDYFPLRRESSDRRGAHWLSAIK